MGGLLTGAAVAETMSLTGGSAAAASSGGTAMLGTATTAVAEAAGSLGSVTLELGGYAVSAPVVLVAAVGVCVAALTSYFVVKRLRGSNEETQSLLRGSAYGSRGGEDMV
jgi:hypothetical protein